MTEESSTRKLTAILYADVAGHSRLTQADEIGTHRQLSVSLDLVTDRIRNAGERVMHYAGHALLAAFESVVAQQSRDRHSARHQCSAIVQLLSEPPCA